MGHYRPTLTEHQGTTDRIEHLVKQNGSAGCTTAWLCDQTGLSPAVAWKHLRTLEAGGKVVLAGFGMGARWLHMHAIRAMGVPLDELLAGADAADMEVA